MIRHVYLLIIFLISNSVIAIEKEELLSYVEEIEATSSLVAFEFMREQQEGDFSNAYKLGCDQFRETTSPFGLRKTFKHLENSAQSVSLAKLQSTHVVISTEYPFGIAQFTLLTEGQKGKYLYHVIGVNVERKCINSSSSRLQVSNVEFK
ncbi:hypothetical protein A1OO_09540 [Enterovibrio norvegicus FF-33]|uniref:DUF4019 domain-containing protein n=2 Tax=Enterovibrio norvegicus TaxID=188144 RepID=A0A1E5C759_9GAMM|nr:hypothetical protein [Enterovibrio norvegicus]OEE61309.1 hypothetical protein A1OK_21190 [Enterovibrio norvegicus FF-454]OEE66036.1 hypothetical protein A1OO_09540 [Enterovibrio norvegicus FF-33]